MTSIDIYRPGSPPTLQASVNIGENTTYQKKLMGEHSITSEFISPTILSIQIGDYISYASETFTINRLPDIEKTNNSTFKYNVRFEGVLFDLNKKLFISSDGLCAFSYTGEPIDFITNIVANLNVTGSGWSVGTVDSGDSKKLDFNNEYCRSALTRIAETFNMEFSLTGKAISLLNSVGVTTAYSFSYGRDLGLYKLTRQQVNDSNILTKVYGFGGEKNIPSDYRSRARRLVFETGGVRYLTKNVSTYGTIEGQFTDDNIYPKRTAPLTDVNIDFDAGVSGTEFNNRTSYLVDEDIDFDINDYLIEGQTATIVFKSGDLSGVECEIWKSVYDPITPANNRIYFNPSVDKDGYTLPFYNGGSPILPAISDLYTLVNISMPASYVTAAETELQVATQAFLDENCIPQVVYSVELDPKYAKSIALDIDAGDKVTIVDAALGISSLIRISGIEYPLTDPYRIKAIIADFVPYTLQERIIKKTVENKNNILLVDQLTAELARINALRLKRKTNAVPMYQGIYAAGTTYYGTLSRVDIVKYNIPDDDPDEGDIYFIARPDAPSESFSGIVPTNTDYWERFEAQYSSIATDLLFANLAYIDNLGVKYFNGIPVPVGDLAGSVVNTQANVVAIAQVSTITLNGDSGSAKIYVGALSSKLATFNTDLNTTASDFVTANAAYYNGHGITLTFSVDDLIFTEQVANGGFGIVSIENFSPNLNGSLTPAKQTEGEAAVKRIDTVTLTGTSGMANVLCDGTTKIVEFVNNLTETTAAFVALYAADYLTGGVVVTSSGTDIIFTADIAGVDFTGSTTITNIVNNFKGAVKIAGNDIWENTENNDDKGVIKINYKGYAGGYSHKRITIVGDGQGSSILTIGPFGISGLWPGLDVRKGALTVPRYITATDRDAIITNPAYGMIIYLISTSKFQGYTGSSWANLN